MMINRLCFEKDCDHEAQYVCKCSSPEAYCCQFHLGAHLMLPNRTHAFDSIFLEPCEESKNAILEFLAKLKITNEEWKKKAIVSFSQNLCGSEYSLDEIIKKLDSSCVEINNWYEKISNAQRISKLEQDPLLKLLNLQPDAAIEGIKAMIPESAEPYSSVKLFCILSEEIEKIIERFIKDKFESFLDKKISKIEQNLRQHDKTIDFKLSKMKSDISSLNNENESNKSTLEALKQDIKTESQTQINSLNIQISSFIEDFNKKLNSFESANSNFNQKNQEFLNTKDVEEKGPEALCNKNPEQNSESYCELNKDQNTASDPTPIQGYEENKEKEKTKTYSQITPLYLAGLNNYFADDSEGEVEEVKEFKHPPTLEKEKHAAQPLNSDRETLAFINVNPASARTRVGNRRGVRRFQNTNRLEGNKEEQSEEGQVRRAARGRGYRLGGRRGGRRPQERVFPRIRGEEAIEKEI